ncbi:tripartite motif-containing protein 3-like [Branchiostoma lanceolatum]|uniref:tripartite motif-containing protein 3-like n=1 Tax=Branchiostoma lanceolatum TaxID=7740 RepID=UPI00345566FA
MSSDTYEEAEAVKLKKLPVQKARQQRERRAKSRLEAINVEDIRRHADLSSKETNAYVGFSVEPEKVSFGGEGSDPGKFLRNYGVAVSADNEIYATDVNNERIQVFSINGVFLRLFPALVPGGLERNLMQPHDVALDANGFLWVVGNIKVGFLHEVHVVQYNRDGQPMATFKLNSFARFPTIAVDAPKNNIIVAVSRGIIEFSAIGLSGSFEIEKGEAIGYITHGNDGNILVTDRSSNSVRVYNRTGKLLLKFGEGGTGEGQLRFPQGICTDKFGHVMVANWGNDRVDTFTSRGEFVRTVVKTPSPLAIAIGPAGQLVVTDSLTDTVIIFRLHGL